MDDYLGQEEDQPIFIGTLICPWENKSEQY